MAEEAQEVPQQPVLDEEEEEALAFNLIDELQATGIGFVASSVAACRLWLPIKPFRQRKPPFWVLTGCQTSIK